MIVPAMTHKEIAEHLMNEISDNQERIKSKVSLIAKRMQKAGKTVFSYEQTVGSKTRLTIYIYGIDKKGVDYAVGAWIHSKKGLCWVTVGAKGVNFYIAHFFKRYAERILMKHIGVKEAATEFYHNYKVAVAKSTKILPDGTHEIQCPIPGGLALGVRLDDDILVYNTCVVSLWPDQVKNIEDDRELNDAIQAMDWRTYRNFVEGLC